MANNNDSKVNPKIQEAAQEVMTATPMENPDFSRVASSDLTQVKNVPLEKTPEDKVEEEKEQDTSPKDDEQDSEDKEEVSKEDQPTEAETILGEAPVAFFYIDGGEVKDSNGIVIGLAENGKVIGWL